MDSEGPKQTLCNKSCVARGAFPLLDHAFDNHVMSGIGTPYSRLSQVRFARVVLALRHHTSRRRTIGTLDSGDQAEVLTPTPDSVGPFNL